MLQKKESHHLWKCALGQDILVSRRVCPHSVIEALPSSSESTSWSLWVVQLWLLIIDPLILILLELYIWNTMANNTIIVNLLLPSQTIFCWWKTWQNTSKHYSMRFNRNIVGLQVGKSWSWAPATIEPRKIPSYLPLYCLFDRDPYHSLLQSQYNWVV